jgi:ribonucleoside-diphosphate reductase alpha chain
MNAPVRIATVEMQPTSQEIWASKYQLKDNAGNAVDQSISDTFNRVADALVAVEKDSLQVDLKRQFLWALENGAYPAGRILSNAGAAMYKPATSTINCTVSATIHDSLDDILNKVHRGGLTLKSGSGVGYEFSTLRPKGAYVSGSGSTTSGPLSFMDIFDKMCFTISSAGGRRGAQMATFDIHHPDAMEFIKAKREDGRLRQFNLSLLITEAFIQAVKNDDVWKFSFPAVADEIAFNNLDINNPDQIVYREFPVTDGYVLNDHGEVACRVYKTVKARMIWDTIMQSTYDFAEPGFILIDKVNEMNNNWFCKNIRAANPCAEQMLPGDGSCLLGSVNLVHFVDMPFTHDSSFNFAKFREVVRIFTRMLDNVVEINGLPLQAQRDELTRKRRHGMGYLGLGSALTMLGIKYGSDEAVALTEDITREMAIEGYKSGLDLAKEKGAAPIMNEDFIVTQTMIDKRPEMAKDGLKVGDTVKGSVLHAKYSRYMQRLATVQPDLVDELAAVGCRFTHHSSIAPTGTLALSVANNASNGIEPSFAHHYFRNVIINPAPKYFTDSPPCL